MEEKTRGSPASQAHLRSGLALRPTAGAAPGTELGGTWALGNPLRVASISGRGLGKVREPLAAEASKPPGLEWLEAKH